MSRHYPDDVKVSADEFNALFLDLKRWRRWGEHDQRGALHYLTPQRIAEAARLARDGVSGPQS
jgi:hypothetical protein